MSYQHNPVGLLEQVALVELRSPQESTPVSLEARLLDAFASSAVDSARRVGGVRQLLDSPDITHPEKLAVLQEQMGQYNVDINLLNTLVRKAVGAAETLLRSS
ncbi:type III secretion system protein PrgJ [Pseudomonas agarici]|uniref:Type III secretion system protein PrgJ n=1 Tax=Pseudomonas agarici TaxID=46677 RepID=A0A0X1T7S5_PSEAA|nr:type III secretion system inner rod subunit SctI [Pseudomonas agarici]AMB87992.1 type III secretion system protein PrgJ [Pseudomonas agarici]NWB92871.1 type III secretion system inner rod subunit SctI [Pseudomonas agarici]NWC09138.1 type III secretion system inner rod subunit SctI [Pseudomonas agarici]SEK33512.1 hypothetical protein SAMN05216604_102167 [Pseudomonas agarici]